MKDILEQFAQLKRKLTQQRETLTERLAAINEVLENPQQRTVPEIRTAGETVQTTPKKRGTGKLTLDQAVLAAFGMDGGTKGNGKTIGELLSLVQTATGNTRKVTRPTIGLACFRLKKKGQIKNVGRGVYSLA
jgi:hypothetical protein